MLVTFPTPTPNVAEHQLWNSSSVNLYLFYPTVGFIYSAILRCIETLRCLEAHIKIACNLDKNFILAFEIGYADRV